MWCARPLWHSERRKRRSRELGSVKEMIDLKFLEDDMPCFLLVLLSTTKKYEARSSLVL